MRLHPFHILLPALLVAVLPLLQPAAAQRLGLQGSSLVQLNISPDATGYGSDENADTRIRWRQVRNPSKVTVSTFAPGQTVRLTLDPENVVRGTPVGPVELTDGMPDADLIVNITERGAGSADLRYTAEINAEDGLPPGGTERHTVIFTITEQ